MRWLQDRYAAHQSGSKPLTPGEKKVFTHHFIKMQVVLSDDDPAAFLQGKANQVTRAMDLNAHVKNWSTERRTMFHSYQSYEAEPLLCSKHVWAAVPVLCDQMQRHLEELHNKHAEDDQLRPLIPHPAAEHSDHPLVANVARMREGLRDFDVYCILWTKSKRSDQSGPKKAKKTNKHGSSCCRVPTENLASRSSHASSKTLMVKSALQCTP